MRGFYNALVLLNHSVANKNTKSKKFRTFVYDLISGNATTTILKITK